MIVKTLEIRLYAPWVHSLKEKRMIVKSLTAKIRNTFNVSVSEVEAQDVHQTIVLGIACVTSDSAFADSTLENIIDFIERSTEAEITKVNQETR